jgi:tRNA(Arg) A34 adenosine deaminase TadA
MKFLKLLKKLSTFSDHGQHKMSCVIADKNRVVTMGFNSVKTHSKSTAKFHMLHAELSAILGFSYEDLRGCTAYVFRQHRDGNFAMARPCPACEAALRQVGIKKVIYSVENSVVEMKL